MAVSTMLGTVEAAFQETLTPTILEHRADIDPFQKHVFVTSEDVEVDSTYLGRDYKVRQIIETGVAGATEYDDILGNNVLTERAPTSGYADLFTLMGPNAPRVYPGLMELSSPGWLPIAFQLQYLKGNAVVSADLASAEMLPSLMAKPIAATMRGLSRNVNLTMANAFWKELVTMTGSVDVPYVASFTSPASGTPTIRTNGYYVDGAYAMLTLDSTACVRKLAEGQRYDLYYDSSGPVRINAGDQPVWVDNIDPLSNKINLKIKNGTTITLPTGTATTVYLVPRKSVPAGSATFTTTASGPADWIKSTGTLGVATTTGGSPLSLSTYPMLKSYIKAVSGTLTEISMMGYLARCEFALGDLWQVDTLVGRSGIFVQMFAQTSDAGRITTTYRINRDMGQPGDMSGGMKGPDGLTFVYNGRTYKVTTTPWAPSGVLYGFKTSDGNIRMHVPPRDRDAGTNAMISDAVSFEGPRLGFNSIFCPVYSPVAPVASLTNVTQMPFKFLHEFWPKFVVGLKLTGITDGMADAM